MFLFINLGNRSCVGIAYTSEEAQETARRIVEVDRQTGRTGNYKVIGRQVGKPRTVHFLKEFLNYGET